MQPGWYSDPFSRAGLRWWDGAAWTSHTSWQQPAQWVDPTVPTGYPPYPTQQAYQAWQGFDPRRDLADQERAARRAMWALVVIAAVQIVSELVVAIEFGHALRDAVRQIRDSTAVGDNTPDVSRLNHLTLALQGFSVLAFIPQILFWIWLYRAATVARRAGLPARRDPVWAWLGFIVPIVNFWFPYQVATDALPQNHPARRTVNRWWALWISQYVAAIPVIVVSYFSTPVAVVLALGACTLSVFLALTARTMITQIGEAHRQLLAPVG